MPLPASAPRMAAVLAMAPEPSSTTGRRAACTASASGVSPAPPGPGAAAPAGLTARASPAGALSSMFASTGPGGGWRASRTSCPAAWAARFPPMVATALATDRPSAAWSSR